MTATTSSTSRRAAGGVGRRPGARAHWRRVLSGAPPERVADGVWLVRGNVPRQMYAYLVEEEGGGALLYDAGVRTMAPAISAAARRLGDLTRIVLGHAHADHRGAAPELADAHGVPVLCHAAERASAEGDGGFSTFDLTQLPFPGPQAYSRLLHAWDGGPVTIADTLAEGDLVAGFRVLHLPGHAAGQIALVRERDGVALTSDAFYTANVMTTRTQPPQVAHPAFTPDVPEAARSMLRLADAGPSVAWPGHAVPVRGDVAAQLRRGAAPHA